MYSLRSSLLSSRQSICHAVVPIARTSCRSLITRSINHKSLLNQSSKLNNFKVLQSSSSSKTLRPYSVLSASPKAKQYKYEDVKELVTHPEEHPNTVLVDVREPVEFNDGHIPNAINIPLKSSPGALDLTPEDFEDNFGFEKPAKDQSLVFYCLGGVRSTAAEELAETFGYENRGNYVGSWEDWITRENAKANNQANEQQAKL